MPFAIQTDSALVFEEQRGQFLCRKFLVTEYLAVCDVNARPLELTQVYDPFEGFHDPDDFPRFV